MSKLFNILLACVAVLLLSEELKADAPHGVRVIIVKDIKSYRADNPEGRWEPLEHIENFGFVLGKRNESDILVLKQTISLYYPTMKDSEIYDSSFLRNTKISFLFLRLKLNVNGGQAFLLDGGIGENFVSVVFEFPNSPKKPLDNLVSLIFVDDYNKN